MYQSRLVKWLTLENEKKTAISQDWQHKKEKPSYQSFSLMVSYRKMWVLSKLKQYWYVIFGLVELKNLNLVLLFDLSVASSKARFYL